jgi:hypothetical protein
MPSDHEVQIFIPLNLLNSVSDVLENFQELFMMSVYSTKNFSNIHVPNLEGKLDDLRDAIGTYIKFVDYEPLRKPILIDVNFEFLGNPRSITICFNRVTFDFWNKKLNSFPLEIWGFGSRGGVSSLFLPGNREIFLAMMHFLPVRLGRFLPEGWTQLNWQNNVQERLEPGTLIDFDRLLILGDEIIFFFEDYFLHEVDFFYKKLISPARILLAGYKIFINAYSQLEDFSLANEIGIQDRLHAKDENKLFQLEITRLKILEIPKRIPNFEHWKKQ